jgi:hypothetical protein
VIELWLARYGVRALLTLIAVASIGFAGWRLYANGLEAGRAEVQAAWDAESREEDLAAAEYGGRIAAALDEERRRQEAAAKEYADAEVRLGVLARRACMQYKTMALCNNGPTCMWADNTCRQQCPYRWTDAASCNNDTLCRCLEFLQDKIQPRPYS